jgi:hypothetical protein
MFFLSKKAKEQREKQREIDYVISRVTQKNVSHVTERDTQTYTEEIIGKNGGLAECDDEILVICDGHEVFRADRYSIKIGELMSHDGATLSGFDKNTSRHRSLMLYYKYYR